MRSARVVRRSSGSSVGGKRARPVPAFSRLTIRSLGGAPLSRPLPLNEALRASREALTEIQRELDMLLESVRKPAGRPGSDAAERLRQVTARANVAMARLVGA